MRPAVYAEVRGFILAHRELRRAPRWRGSAHARRLSAVGSLLLWREARAVGDASRAEADPLLSALLAFEN